MWPAVRWAGLPQGQARRWRRAAVPRSGAALKARMGHDSARAAMINQHAVAEADQKIAEALNEQIGFVQPEQGDA